MHLVIEAMKLGYADRDEYYADPRFAKVPMEQLLSQSYTQLRRSLIDLRVASMDRRPGDPILHRALATTETPAPLGDAIPKQDTTTCVVADRFGNWIAATPSCNLLTNKPGPSGVNTGNRVRSLNTAPGHPNRVEAGKRPRITLTPTLVLREGKPVVAISVAGGDLQDQTTLNLLISHIDYGLLPADAVTQPRFSTSHHQDSFDPNPDRTAAFVLRGGVAVNDTIPASVQKEMAERGHVIKVEKGPIAHPVMIYLDRTTGTMYAAGDPAAKRHAKAIP
jgi:gamma-glutamyltranspeptidase/glutathione hydrolase